MSLGDHLEELRVRLILAILGLAVGVAVSLIFGTQILHILEWPYNKAVRNRTEKRLEADAPQREAEAVSLVETVFKTLTDRLASDPNVAPDLDPKRVAFYHDVSVQAVEEWVREKHSVSKYELDSLTSLGPAEAFMAYMKIAMIAGLILTCPWVFYQIWMFVAAGLYPKERHYVYKAVPFSAALFVIGALFFLFVIARVTLAFFLGFGDLVNVASQWTLQKYVSFITLLMLVFGLAFQTPIAVFILVRTGLVTIKTLRTYRKYVLLGLAVVSAIATPSPDPLSMLALLIPLYALYEVGIILSIRAEKKAAQKKTDEAAPA